MYHDAIHSHLIKSRSQAKNGLVQYGVSLCKASLGATAQHVGLSVFRKAATEHDDDEA